MSGFTLSDSAQNITMNIVNPGIRFHNNRILRAREVGLLVVVSTGSITDNLISGGDFGLRLCGGGANFVFEGNTFTGNGIGIFAECPGAAVNGGSTAGRANVIACNTGFDVWVFDGIAFSAVNNRWDHAPPTASSTQSGVDIVLNVGASAVTTGATLAPSPCP